MRYTGEPCDHEHRLCERESGKAIELCQGLGPNLLFLDTPQVARSTQ